MISNAQIQQGLVSYLKASASITAEIPVDEIRENEWQGTDFTYPNIRVRLLTNIPQYNHNQECRHSLTLSIMVFTEDYSSQKCDTFSGIIGSVLHGRSFSANNLQYHLRATNIVPAVRSDERTWRSEVLLSGTVW